MGRHYLEDVLETMGAYIDSLKFAGGSFALLPEKAVRELIDLCHAHEVLVSTGGFIETVVMQGVEAVRCYIEQCKALGFHIIEVLLRIHHDPSGRLAAAGRGCSRSRAQSKVGSWHSIWCRWCDNGSGIAR
jgi:hypothetical protein